MVQVKMLSNLIKSFLIESAEVDPAKFDQPDLMVSDLALDSLGLIEMLFEIEDKYGFQIPDPIRYMSMSYSEMVADIESTVRAHHNGELPQSDAVQASA